jgi:hypothetical protein
VSGETADAPLGWTPDLLRIHIERLLGEMDRRIDGRFEAAERAVGTAMASAEKAVLKSEAASSERFAGVNEFRQTVTDITNTKIDRGEAEQRFLSLEKTVAEHQDRTTAALSRINSRLDLTAGKSSGLNAAWVTLIGAVTLIGSLIAIVLAVRP